jgi:hypothetical protein
MAIDVSIFADIEANLAILDVDEIKKRLHPVMKGVQIQSLIFNPGMFLYRARKVAPDFTKQAGIRRSGLIYPPKHLVKLGRLNRSEQPVFYCSILKESVLFEVQGLQAGDEIILTFWKTTERMVVNNIGYTEYVFQQLSAKRALPQWNLLFPPRRDRAVVAQPRVPDDVVATVLSKDKSREVYEAFSRYFMSAVGPLETDKYKMTAAIGELHLGEILNEKTRFAGVLYPSARMWANGDNLALLPWYVDTCLEFRKAVHIRIDGRTDATFSITCLDTAKELDSDGKLVWLGRLPQWVLTRPNQVAIFMDTPGVDNDGDYETDKDGHRGHWVAVDFTGQIMEAC